MDDPFSRSRAVFGDAGMEKLKNSRVVVFGIGGVGCAAAEGLARGGIGTLVIVDNEAFDITNLNRQLFSDMTNIGKPKVSAAAEHLEKVSPYIKVIPKEMFWEAGKSDEEIFDGADYIVDAIDTVPSKLDIIRAANEKNIPVISCMGTGNKVKPAMLEVGDIYSTSVCPLAKAVRLGCRKMGISSLKTVFSKETPLDAGVIGNEGKRVPASTSFVPNAAGFIIAGEVIGDLTK